MCVHPYLNIGGGVVNVKLEEKYLFSLITLFFSQTFHINNPEIFLSIIQFLRCFVAIGQAWRFLDLLADCTRTGEACPGSINLDCCL